MALKSAKFAYFFHPVSDIKKALDFFKDTMGFNLIFSNLTETTEENISEEDLANLQWLEFDAGNVNLLVQHVPGIEAYNTGVGFAVENCDEAYVYLKNNDVDIIGAIQNISDKTRFFEIRDPFGNSFAIFGK